VGKEGPDDLGLRITVLNSTETFYTGRNKIATVRVEETEWEDSDGDGVIDEENSSSRHRPTISRKRRMGASATLART
jgi:hypothetical protein